MLGAIQRSAVAATLSPAWATLGLIAAFMAVRALVDWGAILLSGAPIAYGEGGVVHAGQLVARGSDPYGAVPEGHFVSANYPPLAYLIVAATLPLGPFTGLRLVNILALVAIAGLIAWRARASRETAAALGFGFLALMPVASWGPLNRVDPIAVALTAYAICVAGPSWRRAMAAGILGALALYAKPTALLPLAAVLAYLLWREPRTAARVSIGFFAAAILLVVFSANRFDLGGLYTHLVTHNAFPFDWSAPLLLVVLGAITVGCFATVAFRVADGRMRAYIAGALGVVVLSGHEGATFNYLLDLSAASCLALAPLSHARPPRAAALFAGQLVATFTLAVIGPFAGVNLAANAERIAAATGLASDRPHLAEDSGILVATGIEPIVDDIFVWARLTSMGVIADEVTPRVRGREFGTIISDVRLDSLDTAPAYERLRWPDPLVRAVLEHYRLERVRPGSYRYVPRADR